jgi:hypothetical protein
MHNAAKNLKFVIIPKVETPKNIEKITIVAMNYGITSKDFEEDSI